MKTIIRIIYLLFIPIILFAQIDTTRMYNSKSGNSNGNKDGNFSQFGIAVDQRHFSRCNKC